MVYIYIEFINLVSSNIVCKINNDEIHLTNDNNGNCFANLELPKGKYSLTIANRSLYSSPFCYLNIINPIFYIYQLRFLEHKTLKTDEHFSGIKIIVNITNENDSKILFDSPRVKGLNNIQHHGMKLILIEKEHIDALQIKRYKITYIFSNLFYMFILSLLSLAESCSNGNIGENLLFCIFILLFSFLNIKKIKKTGQ